MPTEHLSGAERSVEIASGRHAPEQALRMKGPQKSLSAQWLGAGAREKQNAVKPYYRITM